VDRPVQPLGSLLSRPTVSKRTEAAPARPRLSVVAEGAASDLPDLTRSFERTIANLTAVNPYTRFTDRLMVRMADQTGMKARHMVTTGDPARNPSFVYFADPNYFITDFPAHTCETCINPQFAWNHGDIQPDIASAWLGFVGPGVGQTGQDSRTRSDHADVRPTILALLGLRDTYVHDGLALTETIEESAQPVPLRGHTRSGASRAGSRAATASPTRSRRCSPGPRSETTRSTKTTPGIWSPRRGRYCWRSAPARRASRSAPPDEAEDAREGPPPTFA